MESLNADMMSGTPVLDRVAFIACHDRKAPRKVALIILAKGKDITFLDVLPAPGLRESSLKRSQ